jgi:hypothetical protein
MTPEQIAELMAQIQSVATELRSHVDKSCADMSARFDSAINEIERKHGEAEHVAADEAGHRAVKNAEMRADSASDVRVANSLLAGLARDMTALKKQVTRPMADLNAYADVQAKADAVLRVHGESAEPPMSGEDLVAYNIRMARRMQPHSKTWKGVDLRLIAADSQAFNIALDGIRADALEAGLKPVGLPEFQHRKIVKQMPGGHIMTEFVGTGTFIKQMSRPVRHVAFIGTRASRH